MGTRDLPDMYALSPWACGPRALGIHIRQITRAHVTTIKYDVFAVFHIYNILTYKIPLTPLHKDAIIRGLKRFDHFRRGSLSGSLLIL